MYNSNDKIIKKKAFNAHNRLQIRKIVIPTGITFNDNGKKILQHGYRRKSAQQTPGR